MKLAEYLESEQIAVAEFGRLIGMSRYAVYRWLDGSRYPNSKAMQKIYAHSGGAVTPNDFFGTSA